MVFFKGVFLLLWVLKVLLRTVAKKVIVKGEIASRHAFGSRLRLTAVARNDKNRESCNVLSPSLRGSIAIEANSKLEGDCFVGKRHCLLAMTEEESVFARERSDRSKLGFDVLGGVLRRVSSSPQIVLGTGKRAFRIQR